ncbi:MarR family transcriptional regulator [Pigmentiphaga sp.]|uniref:MarR family winged helix-turn-helix transcriptional regulator n=1 Tax=Pigmentiphaga sp. TaxID=1977564 RepID=UPI00128CA35B|nr:MarR family transcriptional regulator [Pigmentiphaga sp.]MPS28015.1 MarR family transcriptional regulator [Alcaligenaceae bacterium SAGV5]MPS54648.1 MarR family transcriptional regulator [Alcaligenaceae bacterium SAGV3]MPT56979.1 MarR family transcriptional regulator [Alcaligenaceae bacterium]
MLDPTGNEAIDLAAQLRPAILRLNRLLRRETQAFGVSPLMVMLLSTIDKEPGIGVNDLANRENMRAASMSNHVKQLEAAGYIQRDQTLHTDKRRVGLAVTPEGRKLVAEVRKRRTDWLAGRITTLDPDDRAALARAVGALRHLGE